MNNIFHMNCYLFKFIKTLHSFTTSGDNECVNCLVTVTLIVCLLLGGLNTLSSGVANRKEKEGRQEWALLSRRISSQS